MISHLIRLVWNRRRSSLLIASEIFLSFLVLAVIVIMAVYYMDNYRKPLGFAWENVWAIRMNMNLASETPRAPGALPVQDETSPTARRARVARLLLLIRDMPEVVSAASTWIAPYSRSSWTSGLSTGGRYFEFAANEADDTLADALQIPVTSGRWFNRDDDGADWRATVVNERFAKDLFGNGDPVGRVIKEDPSKNPDPLFAPRIFKVVGVIRDFRKEGEYAPAGRYAFFRAIPDDSPLNPRVPRVLLIRTRPKTTAAFEEQVMRRLQAAVPAWTFQPQPMEKARATILRGYVAPVAAAALVAAFLVVMVALGLSGVLWMSVTQRTREIGLRRAKGATAGGIQRQVIGEVLVLTSVAVIAGILVVAQFPLLDVFGPVTPGVYITGLGLAIVSIFLVTIAAAWAPSRMASSIDPAEALRYE